MSVCLVLIIEVYGSTLPSQGLDVRGQLVCSPNAALPLHEYDNGHQTRIVGKGGFWVTSFIYEYETSTTYPLYETM